MAGTRRPPTRKPKDEESVETTETATKGRTRQELGAILNSDKIREKLETLVDETLDLKGFMWGHCPDCRRKVQVEVPDLKGRIDGMIKLLEQAEGKPREDGDAGVTIIVERPPR